ncbi:MAG: hypothetical protein AAF770_01795 [Bacteroidota bacterium]
MLFSKYFLKKHPLHLLLPLLILLSAPSLECADAVLSNQEKLNQLAKKKEILVSNNTLWEDIIFTKSKIQQSLNTNSTLSQVDEHILDSLYHLLVTKDSDLRALDNNQKEEVLENFFKIVNYSRSKLPISYNYKNWINRLLILIKDGKQVLMRDYIKVENPDIGLLLAQEDSTAKDIIDKNIEIDDLIQRAQKVREQLKVDQYRLNKYPQLKKFCEDILADKLPENWKFQDIEYVQQNIGGFVEKDLKKIPDQLYTNEQLMNTLQKSLLNPRLMGEKNQDLRQRKVAHIKKISDAIQKLQEGKGKKAYEELSKYIAYLLKTIEQNQLIDIEFPYIIYTIEDIKRKDRVHDQEVNSEIANFVQSRLVSYLKRAAQTIQKHENPTDTLQVQVAHTMNKLINVPADSIKSIVIQDNMTDENKIVIENYNQEITEKIQVSIEEKFDKINEEVKEMLKETISDEQKKELKAIQESDLKEYCSTKLFNSATHTNDKRRYKRWITILQWQIEQGKRVKKKQKEIKRAHLTIYNLVQPNYHFLFTDAKNMQEYLIEEIIKPLTYSTEDIAIKEKDIIDTNLKIVGQIVNLLALYPEEAKIIVNSHEFDNFFEPITDAEDYKNMKIKIETKMKWTLEGMRYVKNKEKETGIRLRNLIPIKVIHSEENYKQYIEIIDWEVKQKKMIQEAIKEIQHEWNLILVNNPELANELFSTAAADTDNTLEAFWYQRIEKVRESSQFKEIEDFLKWSIATVKTLKQQYDHLTSYYTVKLIKQMKNSEDSIQSIQANMPLLQTKYLEQRDTEKFYEKCVEDYAHQIAPEQKQQLARQYQHIYRRSNAPTATPKQVQREIDLAFYLASKVHEYSITLSSSMKGFYEQKITTTNNNQQYLDTKNQIDLQLVLLQQLAPLPQNLQNNIESKIMVVSSTEEQAKIEEEIKAKKELWDELSASSVMLQENLSIFEQPIREVIDQTSKARIKTMITRRLHLFEQLKLNQNLIGEASYQQHRQAISKSSITEEEVEQIAANVEKEIKLRNTLEENKRNYEQLTRDQNGTNLYNEIKGIIDSNPNAISENQINEYYKKFKRKYRIRYYSLRIALITGVVTLIAAAVKLIKELKVNKKMADQESSK